MKNKIIVLAAAILAVILGYLSGLIVVFNPGDRFIERRSEVKIIDSKTRLYYVLPSDAYLLRFKHTVGKALNKQIIFNGNLLSRDAYIGVRSKRVLQTEYIYLSKEMILPKENTLDIYIPDDKPGSIDVVLSNYRRNINNDIYVLFSDASWAPKKGAITGFIIFYLLFLPAFFLLMIFLIKNIVHIGLKKSLIYQFYSIAPLLLFLSGVNLFNLFNETFNIVISLRYLLIIGILPIFIIEFCIIMNKLLKAKKSSNISLSSSVYFIKQILLFIKGWLEHKEYSNAFIMGGLIFLILCPIFLILGSEPLTERLAEIAYILLAIGVGIKLFNLRGKQQGRIKKK
jgi:hypothetical protein